MSSPWCISPSLDSKYKHQTISANLVLLEDPVYPEHMVEHLIEQDQRHIQLFLVEHLETSLHIFLQLLLLHWEVVLGQPVAVQDGSFQGRLREGRPG